MGLMITVHAKIFHLWNHLEKLFNFTNKPLINILLRPLHSTKTKFSKGILIKTLLCALSIVVHPSLQFTKSYSQTMKNPGHGLLL